MAYLKLRARIDTADPEVCRKILDGTVFDSSLGKNQLTIETSRARPNQRLVRAFGINNGFTTTDALWATEFKCLASDKLRAGNNWCNTAGEAARLVSQHLLKGSKDGGHIFLNEMVQSITLKMSMDVLFNEDPFQLDDGATQAIASWINKLWMLSKDPAEDCTAGRPMLHEALKSVHLDTSQNRRENALNYILPAYETLWRVVLRCFLEVTFRSRADPEWRDVLQSFLLDATTEEFHNVSSPGIPVSHIVNEALRLYPPTRHIHRELHPAFEAIPVAIAADIEGCHRRVAVWGPNSDRFVPGRWYNTTKEMRRAFMPFGGKPFLCPAQADFGPRMIGILVAALTALISPQGWSLALSTDTGHRHFALGDAPLDSARTAYEHVILVRR